MTQAVGPRVHRCHPCSSCARSASHRVFSGAREAKDPKEFKDMDEARAYLMAQDSGPSIPSFLNWLSQGAFGAGGSGLARIYKGMLESRWAQQLTNRLDARPGYTPTPAELTSGVKPSAPEGTSASDISEDGMDPASLARLDEIATLVVTDRLSLLKSAKRYPALLDMTASDVVQRILLVKQLVPGCNVTIMLERQPALFYGAAEEDLKRLLPTAYQALVQGLPGLDVDEMLEEDPRLLFEDVSVGLDQFHQLWDVDEDALRNSETNEIALAIRTLSQCGPPRSF